MPRARDHGIETRGYISKSDREIEARRFGRPTFTWSAIWKEIGILKIRAFGRRSGGWWCSLVKGYVVVLPSGYCLRCSLDACFCARVRLRMFGIHLLIRNFAVFSDGRFSLLGRFCI